MSHRSCTQGSTKGIRLTPFGCPQIRFRKHLLQGARVSYPHRATGSLYNGDWKKSVNCSMRARLRRSRSLQNERGSNHDQAHNKTVCSVYVVYPHLHNPRSPLHLRESREMIVLLRRIKPSRRCAACCENIAYVREDETWGGETRYKYASRKELYI